MKHLLIIFAIATIVASCEKEKKDCESKNFCPVVKAESVPSAVTESFREKYPNVTAEKWFNKDHIGYIALFTTTGTKKLAQFSNNGNFGDAGININGTVSGHTLTVPSQTQFGVTVSGSGTFNNKAIVLTINYTAVAGGPTDSCTDTFTKQ